MSADRVIVNSGNRDNGPVRHTAWGAVFAGAIIALMITFLLNLLFAGIGLANFDPATSNNPLSGYGTGSIIAIIVINVNRALYRRFSSRASKRVTAPW